MGMILKKILLLALTVCLVFLLSGCRTRTTGSGSGNTVSGADSGQTDESYQGENTSDTSQSALAQETGNAELSENGEPGGRTRENPEAARKEYDENAPAEIVPGTDRLLHEEGEGSGAAVADEEAGMSADRLNDQAQETAIQTVPAAEADQMGVSEDAEAADSAITYFTVLLQERAGSLFECQRANVYWETAEDHVTIHKTSLEHNLILNAGAYDVSARLLPENLRVDDGWVARKNPQVIVKIVDGGVLGSGVSSTGAARNVYQRIRSRDGWAAVDAIRNGQVLLLSQELLEAPYLQTAAMLMIARTANPDLYADVDPDKALQMLSEEVTGTLPTGIWYYSGREPGA